MIIITQSFIKIIIRDSKLTTKDYNVNSKKIRITS